MKILFVLWQIAGTITFTGTIVNSSGPTVTATQAPDAATVASTPLLQYYQTYAGSGMQVETITYE